MNNSYLDQSLTFDKHLLAMPVTECGEDMVSVESIFAKRHLFTTFNQDLYLRETVAKHVADAAEEFLEHNMILNLEDAYRSLERQKTKFYREVRNLQEKDSSLSLEDAKAKANTYIAGIPVLAAHTAGAAVDATLIYIDSEKPVDFGASYHTLDEEAVTDNPYISEEGKNNRAFFVEVMEKHGLINYPFEYWHFSMGDVCAAYISEQKAAVYGPVAIDPDSGNITAFVSPRNIKTYF